MSRSAAFAAIPTASMRLTGGSGRRRSTLAMMDARDGRGAGAASVTLSPSSGPNARRLRQPGAP